MGKKDDTLIFEGVVTELLPSAMFRVKLNNSEHVIVAYLGGKLRKNTINILLGDTVDVEVSAYDLNKGRVVYRK